MIDNHTMPGIIVVWNLHESVTQAKVIHRI